MRSLNLDQLRTLTAVAELGGFSAAARQLNLTQPAVSLQIRELEQRFGVRLLERTGTRVQVTAPGQELVEHARRIFRECDVAAGAMRRYRDGWVGQVRIGTTNTALTYLLPSVIRQLREQHPGIELQVTNTATRDTVEHVIKSRFDFGLVTLPIDEAHLRVTALRAEMLVAILPASMRDIPDFVTPAWAAQQSLVLEHPRAAVYSLVMEWLSGQLPLPRTPMHMGTVESMKDVVGLGLGMSIVPDVSVSEPMPGIVVRPIAPSVPCTLALIEHRSRRNEPALEIVRNALLELRAIPEAALAAE